MNENLIRLEFLCFFNFQKHKRTQLCFKKRTMMVQKGSEVGMVGRMWEERGEVGMVGRMWEGRE